MLVSNGLAVNPEPAGERKDLDALFSSFEDGTAKTFAVTMEDMEAFADGKLTEDQFRKRATVNGS